MMFFDITRLFKSIPWTLDCLLPVLEIFTGDKDIEWSAFMFLHTGTTNFSRLKSRVFNT